MNLFEGVISALPTPFKNGRVDLNALQRLVRHQLANGIHGFVVNGTTGESPTLHWPEVEEIFSLVKNESLNRVPVLVGTGANSTEKSIEQSILAQEMGADALLVVTPAYNKPPQRGLVAHFTSVAKSVEVPVMLYNVPGRTAVSLSAQSVVQLSQIPNIIGIKEATGDMALAEQIIKNVPDEFIVSSGDDVTFLDLILRGGKGVISVLSNVATKQTVHLYEKARRKERATLIEFEKLKELTAMLFVEANPIPLKAALKFMGLFESDELRLPLMPLDHAHQDLLKSELKKLGLI